MNKREALIGRINELLGTRLRLRKVAVKELEEMYNAMRTRVEGATGFALGQNVQRVLNAPILDLAKRKLDKKKMEDLTLGDILGAVQENAGDKGILGLGILPRFLRTRKPK